MNVELNRIAEKKLEQLGGDVFGVLVRKDGKAASVDEHGRVQWLQCGQGVEPVGYTNWAQLAHIKTVGEGAVYSDTDHGCDIALYTHPQTAQQGSVPEGWSLKHIDDSVADGYLVKGPGVSHCAWKDIEPGLYLFCEAISEAATPQPEGDGWIKCSERLPKLGQRVQLFSQGVIQHMMPLFDDSDEGLFWDFEVHDYNPPVDMSRDQWRPLPQPPKEGEGDEH